MKGNVGVVIGVLAALAGAGWLWSRNRPAAADVEGSATNPYDYAAGWQGAGYYFNIPGAASSSVVAPIISEEAYLAYQTTEPPVTGTIFSNLQAYIPAVVARGSDFIISVSFNHKGEGGNFNVGAILPVGSSYVSSKTVTLPPAADWAGNMVDLWFSGGPLSSLQLGTMLDVFSFISKPGILFSPSAAEQMEATKWNYGAIQIVDVVVSSRNVG